MTVHFASDLVELHHGSCLDILRADALGYPHALGYHPDHLIPDGSVHAVITDPPYGLSNTDPAHVVEALTKWASGDREYLPTGKGFMGNAWDAFVPPPAVWDQCMRVLKPGGHLLAFAGSRTFDLMTLSIRFAGFDIRDSIAWLYGSGFPKSLDVSKAITGTQLGHGGNSGAIRRATMGDEYTESGRQGNRDGAGRRDTGMADRKLELTPDAQKWEGWGTALKPAFEPIVVARKPLGGVIDVQQRVEDSLRRAGVREFIRWTESAPNAEQTRATHAESASRVGASGTPHFASATANNSEPMRANGQQTTASESPRPGESMPDDSEQPSAPLMAPTANAAERVETSSSRSTTSTEEDQRTDDLSTARSTPSFDVSVTLPDTESFAGIATGLTGSQATVLISVNSGGLFRWPEGLPKSVVVGSTVAANVLAHGTGALNIDASRISTTEKLGGGAEKSTTRDTKGNEGWERPWMDDPEARERHASTVRANVEKAEALGRFPANVILDESQAAALDAQAPRTGGAGKASGPSLTGKTDGTVAYGARNGLDRDPAFYGDSGGASRFFYVAKAPGSERPEVEGTMHATVKPLDLMRYLVRLVTPPGGTVLEPFAGSGTTLEAALLEGFHSIGIERESAYLPLIMQRISKPLQQSLFDQ